MSQAEPTYEQMNNSEKKALDYNPPADFTFQQIRKLAPMGVEAARALRLGSIPDRGSARKKLLTKSLWLNNNKLKSIQNLETIVESLFEIPSQLSWLDCSYNYIREIDESIVKFPNLRIIYFHGNCINKLSEVVKLRKLKHLRTVTFHGNPISNLPSYRQSMINILPQILNLDFSPVVKNERQMAAPVDALKIIREFEGENNKSKRSQDQLHNS